MLHVPQMFLKIAGKSSNLTFSNFVTTSHVNYWNQVNSWKNYENSGMIRFAEINQDSSSYSVLQHIRRVATLKLVSRHCLRYLQIRLIMGGGGVVSEFMWGIVDLYLQELTISIFFKEWSGTKSFCPYVFFLFF